MKDDSINFNIQVSSTQFWPLTYHGRRHIFLWNPTGSSVTFSAEDYGSPVLPSLTWTLFDFPEGTKLLIPASATLVSLYVKCTDEVIA